MRSIQQLLHYAVCSSIYLSLLLLVGCTDTNAETPPSPEPATPAIPYLFADGFESSTAELDDLFPPDNSRWTAIQRVDPLNGANSVALATAPVNEGGTSLRIIAQPSDDVVSKMDLEKQGFFAPTGSTVTISADFFLNSDANLGELFLVDLECCSCWDPAVPNNQCPGVRLKLSGEPGYLAIERGKILGTTLNQRELPFPRRRWVSVLWQMSLAPGDEGSNLLLVDGQKVINAAGKNLPNAAEFRDTFATAGIDFTLQAPLGYERVQVGATANPTDRAVELFVDDFRITVE